VIGRRGFVRLVIGGIVIAFLNNACSQTAMRRIGVLSIGSAPSKSDDEAGWEPMHQLGWFEGKNIQVERRFANQQIELLRPYAEELVRLKVDVIVTFGTEAAFAAKNATTSIPIVLGAAGDPVATGLVPSLARPGGNITGYSIVSTEIETKRASLLHELLPAARRVAVVVNPNNRITTYLRKRAEETYGSLGLEPTFVEATSAQHFLDAPAEAARRRAQALVMGIAWPFRDPRPVMQSAIDYRLPTIVQDRDVFEAGGLMYFDTNSQDAAQRVAAMVDKVLRGTKPGDIPIEQPTRFELGINLKAARALGITVPQSLLLRADEVIR
jgi:putative ABC transport system substrate-binding protein